MVCRSQEIDMCERPIRTNELRRAKDLVCQTRRGKKIGSVVKNGRVRDK